MRREEGGERREVVRREEGGERREVVRREEGGERREVVRREEGGERREEGRERRDERGGKREEGERPPPTYYTNAAHVYLQRIVVTQGGKAGSVAKIPYLHAPIPCPGDQLTPTRYQGHGCDLCVAVAVELHQPISRAHVPHVDHSVMATTNHLCNSFIFFKSTAYSGKLF